MEVFAVLLKYGDLVKTSLGRGFFRKREGEFYLVQHGKCRFRFLPHEITLLRAVESMKCGLKEKRKKTA